MKRSTPIFFALLVIGLWSCSPKVIHFTNSNISVEDYATYFPVNYKSNESELSPEGKEIFNKIVALINDEMQGRAYQVDPVSPDLIVRYELISNQRTEVNIDNFGFYSPIPRAFFSTRTFLESALLIEITDANTKKLVWQASVDLNRYAKRENPKEILEQAVQQLFETYPYQAGTGLSPESSNQ